MSATDMGFNEIIELRRESCKLKHMHEYEALEDIKIETQLDKERCEAIMSKMVQDVKSSVLSCTEITPDILARFEQDMKNLIAKTDRTPAETATLNQMRKDWDDYNRETSPAAILHKSVQYRRDMGFIK